MSHIPTISRVPVGMDLDDASASALNVDRLRTQFRAIAPALEECIRPVSFIPSNGGMLERSSS